jgi:hypothetical protein
MLPALGYPAILELDDDAAVNIQALAASLTAVVMNGDDAAVTISSQVLQIGPESPSGLHFIRMRTREALQVKKENGVTLGRPRSSPDDVVARFLRERTEGKTAYAIARDLNRDAVPTAQGVQVRACAVGVRTIRF